MNVKQILITIALVFAFGFQTKDALTFNDLLIVKTAGFETINGFMNEKGFDYKGKIDKDNNGWTVHTWSFNNGQSWFEWRTQLMYNDETKKVDELTAITYYTVSKDQFDNLISQMVRRGMEVKSSRKDKDGFDSTLYMGTGSVEEQMNTVIAGQSNNYRGTSAYRFQFI